MQAYGLSIVVDVPRERYFNFPKLKIIAVIKFQKDPAIVHPVNEAFNVLGRAFFVPRYLFGVLLIRYLNMPLKVQQCNYSLLGSQLGVKIWVIQRSLDSLWFLRKRSLDLA